MPPELTLALIVPQTAVAVGEPVPVAIEIRNVAARPVWTVGVLDGSENGIRYPHYRPQVTRAGRTVAVPGAPEDPLVSPLREVDFRQLQPGETFDPTRAAGGAAYLPLFTFASFRPDASGLYEFVLAFSTESAAAEQWLGRFSQDAHREAVLRRIAEVPRLTLKATATVHVK